ncbi:hypothetical protein WG66_010682 [Moniliophthora roreri]|nr:hypothetical protein WG66_010682 [Moniliophthora roreri]
MAGKVTRYLLNIGRYHFHPSISDCFKTLKQHIYDEEFEGPHLVVLILIMLIEMATSRSPETVWEALDGGLVTAMFKAQRFYAYKKPEASGRGGNGGL